MNASVLELNCDAEYQNKQFFSTLKSKLNSNVPKEQSNYEVFTVQKKYFKHFIILTALNDHLHKKIQDKSKLIPVLSEQKECDVEPFYLKQIQKYFPEKNGVIEVKLSNKDVSEKVENIIKDFCIKILDFSYYLNDPPFSEKYKKRNWENLFIENMCTLTSKASLLNPELTALLPMNAQIQEAKGTYYKLLCKELSMLEELLELWKQRCNYRLSYVVLVKERAAVLALKFKTFELELLIRTYSDDAVAALKLIKKDLDERMTEASEELLNVKADLNAYSILGPSYEKMVEQYGNLVKAINHQNWVINYFKTKSGADT